MVPLKETADDGLRTEKKYKESFARTERLYKSPIYSYRGRLNVLVASKGV